MSDQSKRNVKPRLEVATNARQEEEGVTRLVYTFDIISDDIKSHIMTFLNAFDAVGYVCFALCNNIRVLFVNKKFFNLFWNSIVTLIATTPHQMDVMKTVLTKIEKEYPKQLLMMKNMGWWSIPGQIKFPVDRQVLEIIHKCTNVLRFIIGKGQSIINLNSDDLQLLKSLSHLELIEIDHIDMESSAFVSNFSNSCKGCSSCSSLTTNGSLIDCFPGIKSFRVRGVNCLAESPLVKCLNGRELKRVGVWGSGQILDSEIFSLPVFPDSEISELILSSCTSSGKREVFQHIMKMRLKHLGLFYSQNNNSEQDSDFRLLSDIPTLTSFHIGGWNLTNEAFRALSNNTNLENISISRAQAISREGITYIARNNTITTLRISACIFLRDYDCIPLENMIQLKRLDLDNTKSITDNFLKAFFLGKDNRLSELYVMGIPLISDRGLEYIKDSNLNTLVIKNCQNITENGVISFREWAESKGRKITVVLDNSEYIQKQQQQQQQGVSTVDTQVQSLDMIQHHLAAVEKQIVQKLLSIEQQQPLQEEQGLQIAYHYQEQLQQLHNMLINQQRLQQALAQQLQDKMNV
jgi:hypothetical protein